MKLSFSALVLVAICSAAGATFTVTNVENAGPGSFRQAILDANMTTDPDTIAFNIPGTPPHTISLTSILPRVTQPATIDGSSQPGFAGQPIIEIEASQVGTGDGLVIAGANSLVRSLVLNRFGTTSGNRVEFSALRLTSLSNRVEGCYIGCDLSGAIGYNWHHTGIRIDSADNMIGGTDPSKRNVISGCMWEAIQIYSASATRNRVEGNFLGVDASGTFAIGNGWGVICWTSNNRIGGTSSGAGNVIAGNRFAGLDLFRSSGTIVEGNLIGTDASGKIGLGNGRININMQDTRNALIGGANPAARNVISGSEERGIYIQGAASGNRIQGNFIGTDISGLESVPNRGPGIEINGGNDNLIGGDEIGAGNLIAFNDRDGVFIPLGARNRVRGNSIHSNLGLGIDLGSTDGPNPNDTGDLDSGPNLRQNFPVLENVTTSGAAVLLRGNINTRPNKVCRIDAFASEVCAGDRGQGQRWLGFFEVTTDGAGNAGFETTLGTLVRPGESISVTAELDSNTSEFSPCRIAEAGALRPILKAVASPTTGEWKLSWPRNAEGFHLQSSTSLGPEASWIDVVEPALTEGERYVVTLTAGADRFFRLVKSAGPP